jgi:transposase InsO family protein
MVKSFSDKVAVSTLCKWGDLPSSVFYYVPGKGKRGAKPSTQTRRKDGTSVSNEQVLTDIRTALNREFCCYGYHNITDDLREMNYVINHKKVYRLMDENNLLLGKVIRTNGKREFVQFRKIAASYPMEYVCLDIKYVWVDGEKRNYYLLTIIDVYSRKVIDQIFQRSIRKTHVINMFRRINSIYGIKGVIIRNDNGSQFIANDVKQYLKSVEARQQFTHIATPEENSYIEAFHSIIDREVIQRYVFTDFYDAKLTFEAHLEWYNHSRKHGSIGRITPQKKWDDYEKKKILARIIFALSGKAEAGNAGEQPTRNNLSNENDPEELLQVVSSGSLENHYCSNA